MRRFSGRSGDVPSIWSSLVVAIIIVGLVTMLFWLVRKGVYDRQEAARRQEALHQRELESVGVSRAIRHFRHDMGNQLSGVMWAWHVLRSGLETNDQAEARRALEELNTYVGQFMTFVKEFRVDADGERPSSVDMTELVRRDGRDWVRFCLAFDETKGLG